MRRETNRWIIAGALILVALHATVLFLVIPQFKGGADAPINLQGSPDGYDQLAASLLAGHGYRFYPDTASTLMREPGYPLLLAGLFRLFGPGFTSVRLCNMVMAFCAAWLMIPMARKLLRDNSHSALACYLPSLLFLVHPGTIIAESRAGVELPVALLLVCFLRLVCAAVTLDKQTYYAAAGLLLGVIALFRSTPLLFPVFLFALLLLQRRSELRLARLAVSFALMVFASVSVLSPWIARNFEVTGRLIPTASVLGVSAEAGQYINEHLFEGRPWWLLDREAARKRDSLALEAGYKFKDGPQGYYQTFYKTSDELSFSSYLTRVVVQKYVSQPWLFGRTVVQNLFNFWFAGKTWSATAADALIQIPYLFLACVGFRYTYRHTGTPLAAIVALFIVYMMLVHAPILAQARYSIPLVPLVSLLAGAGLVPVLGRLPIATALRQPRIPDTETIATLQ